ncbi:hypothetical protein DL768_007458 [Monosporascus sp. mg162]|nr:hypothetical protein DL768_007458 [Monosporascus sp. mg162]
MTYYDPKGSLGPAAGVTSVATKSCGKTMRIHRDGKTTTAKVVDKCKGYAGDSINVTKAVFDDLADLNLDRVQVTREWA